MPGEDVTNEEANAADPEKSFWVRFPGILTAVTGFVVAITALIAGLVAAGLIGGDDESDDADTSDTSAASTSVSQETGFTESVQLTEGNSTFFRFSFTTDSNTTYRSTVSEAGGGVVWKSSGMAFQGQRVVERAEQLEPGTRYQVQVSLGDAGSVAAPPVEMCTAGVVTAEQVVLQNLRVTERDSTFFRVDYTTNVCANGSFVITKEGQDQILGSNSGQATGSVTAHWGIPGVWTSKLEPATNYTIELTVEANGQGFGPENMDSDQVTVRTASAG